MPRKSAFFGLLLAALAPFPAFALGLGEIQLESSLNEPLEAYIELISVEPADLDVFAAQVASLETFNRYGLDRPDFLADLRFVMTRGRYDQPVLKVVSTRPITEPFVTFLVEANWTRGRLLREYTVLLDPPVFNTESAPPAVAAPQSATSQLAPQAGFVPRPEPQPAPAPRRTREPVIAASGSSYGPVRRNQTLWEIAASAREGSGLTMNQMMIAIYRENPDAFMGNINLLKEGSTLRIPDTASAARVAQRDALATAVAHNDAWRAGGKVSGSGAAPARAASPTSPTSSAAEAPRRLKLVAPDGDAASGVDAAAVADLRDALEDERNRSAELADDVESLRRELEETKRLFSLKSSDMAELQARLAEQQDDVDAAEFVPAAVDSGSDDGAGSDTSGDDGSVDAGAALTAAADGSTPGGGDGASSGDDAGRTDPQATVSDTQDSPAATTTPVAATPPVTAPAAPIQSAPGLLDRVLGWWPYLLGLLALGAGGAFLAMRRRDSSDADSWDSLTADSGSASQPVDATIPAARAVDASATEEVEYFEDTGTFKPVDFAGSGVDDDAGERGDFPFEEAVGEDDALKLDQSDPLAEADFHMAYGLYDQAAELVSAASARDPSRRDLKMKLLEIYFVWGNKDAFRDAATALHEDIGDTADADWDKILIMGKQICPDEALFSGGATGGGGDDIDLQLDATAGAESLDLETGEDTYGQDDGGDGVDLDLGEALGAASATAEAADNIIDFDFGGETTTASDDADEALRTRIRSATDDAEDTEEMDLSELGVDLDFGETGAYDDADDAFSSLAPDDADKSSDAASADDAGDVISMSQTQAALDIDDGDFDALFGGLDESTDDATGESGDPAPAAATPAGEERDKLLDTSELKVEMEELLNAGSMLSDDDDPTASAVQSLDDPADDAARTGSFSAEIRSLTGSDFDDVDLQFDEQASAGGDDDTALLHSITDNDDDDTDLVQGIDESGDEDTVLAETLFEEPAAEAGGDATAQVEAAGESVDFDDIFGADDATQLSESPFADEGTSEMASFDGVFGDTDEAPQVDAEAVDIFGGADTSEVDEDAAEIFGGSDDGTVETGGVDLDVGEALHESGDGTTVRVAAADLALPDSDETSTSEIGTKLDLARAYMEMGDPDGARGILQEVIEEGDSDQQQDARALMDALPS